jgi:hypothetical protein
MTDKVQKIREEVERLQNELIQEKGKGFGSDTDDACILELQNVLTYIDSLQEEPVSEDFENALAEEWKGYNDRGAAKVDALEDNTQELAFAKGFYRGWHYKKEEPVSDDLGEYINELSKQFPEVSFAKLSRIAVRVSKWQKEQINEVLLSEVLPCFMHGGDADEVVAKLDEVLNKK